MAIEDRSLVPRIRGRRFRKAVSREVVRELRESQGVATGGRFAAWLDGAVQSGQVPMHFSPREATKLTAAQAGLNLLSAGAWLSRPSASTR